MYLFPRVQFIASAHSPLFVLGMQAKYGDTGMTVTEMPSGRSITAEGYREFKNALDVLRVTQGFDSMVIERMNSHSTPLILCEGETDPKYIITALEILGESSALQGIAVDWIGKRDGVTGGSRGAGKDNLDRAWQLLTSNPDLAGRPVLLLYDNDAKKADIDEGRTSIRMIPSNPRNTVMTKGVENLLSPTVFTAELFREHTHDDGNGKIATIRELNKVALCARLCDESRNPSDFDGFSVVVDIIRGWREGLGLDAAADVDADPGRPPDALAVEGLPADSTHGGVEAERA